MVILEASVVSSNYLTRQIESSQARSGEMVDYYLNLKLYQILNFLWKVDLFAIKIEKFY